MPYESEFSCPGSFNGKCVTLQSAYKDSLSGNDLAPDRKVDDGRDCAGGKCRGGTQKIEPASDAEAVAHVTYKESLFRRFDNLLKEPKTPVVAPPQVMRVLLLPYKGEGNELFMLRYVYFFVDEPKWVLGDSLEAMEE
jgi:conjugal transfer pilus assembly protein TraV